MQALLDGRLIAIGDLLQPSVRAPGEAPGSFALESAMDELAYELSIDPLELRLRNHADTEPSTGKPWSQLNPRVV